MDLTQRKLNKSEWTSIEVPVSPAEIDILNLIIAGFKNVNIKINNKNSIFTFLKIEYSEKMEDNLYNKYFRQNIEKIEDGLKTIFPEYKSMKIDSKSKINSADKIRLERYDENLIRQNDIYEFILLIHIEKIIYYSNNNHSNTFSSHYFNLFCFHYYTLYKLAGNNILRVNRHIVTFTKIVLSLFEDKISFPVIIQNAVEFVEKNDNLLKYGDLQLYEHQKEIFTIFKNNKPKLVLYMAPTGTGKTLTPIALSEEKKIIFVCAARHVGLALAKAAISVKKKIAFAFGCASADDIRLHYFAAKVFTKNKRTGGIGKVDNSVGDNVEIIICDIKSYLPAMYYMLAFNKAHDMILYWDEPTITMDYPEHNFHSIIRQNWKQNLIPNIVLSSATLPKLNELTETLPDFLNKFPNAEICNIVSHDCKKSIPIINKNGYAVLPHYLSENFDELQTISHHCENYLTLLRYFDLKEVVEFISYIITNGFLNKKMAIMRHFETLNDINMTNIKIYYVKLLKSITRENWDTIYSYFQNNRVPRILENNKVDPKGNKIIKTRSLDHTVFKKDKLEGTPIIRLNSEQVSRSTTVTKENIVGTSGAYVTTKDSYTLTDGPTIFMTNEVEKIAKFCIQQANIPAIVMEEIMKKIDYNNAINERLHLLESEVDIIKDEADKKVKNEVSGFHSGIKVNSRNKSSKDAKKINRESSDELEQKGTISKLTNEINSLRSMIKSATLNDTFIPNKKLHLNKWAEDLNTKGAFTSNIDENIVSDIMALNNVENSWKVLLMMGIGVFINHDNITYTEIMKRLADEQKLYMIIASSDYIYGTNYQFCHGYLSKDLDLTQEKIIQAMGRIGRNNIQQTYTVRFRDDKQILKLFTNETDKPEIINMNILFNTRKLVWQDNRYVEVAEEDENEIINSDILSLEEVSDEEN